jgi:hypothetical protein
MYLMLSSPVVFSLRRSGLLLSLYTSVYILNGACMLYIISSCI